MKKFVQFSKLVALAGALLLTGCGGSDTETFTNLNAIDPQQPVNDWKLVWSDEFDGTSIDASKWTHEVNCLGGGNQEKQCYTDNPANSFIDNGVLKIVALPAEDGAPQPYTSARLNTQYKADFTYGRIEMRAKLPQGQGTWPAFWMMPTDSVYGTWPRSGEIDIMEAVNLGVLREDGTIEQNVYGTLHYGSGPLSDFSGNAYDSGSNPADDFNTYAIEWQEGEIRWYMNDVLYATQRQSELRRSAAGDILGLAHRGWYATLYNFVTNQLETDWSKAPFDQDFHLILNLAVGGNWPESVNLTGIDASAFENGGQSYEIDYVRVFECSQDPLTGRGCETVAPGYDVDVADGGKLVTGRAPSPTLNPGAPNPITIFDDETNVNWVAWDCCGGSTPALIEDDADRGNVYQFAVENGNDGTVFGFITRSLFLSQDPTSQARATPHNALGMIDGGYVTFDVKVVSLPTNPNSVWKFKIEADEAAGGAWEADLTNFGPAPIQGEWATYRVPLQDIADAGVDLTLLDVVMVFPAWQTGDGAVFRMDNVAIKQDTGGQSFPSFSVFDGSSSEDPDWALWDCCGGSTPTIVNDDVKGPVARFAVENGNSGTVLGFITRGSDGGNDTPINVTEILSNGVLSFDMRVENAPAAGNEGWLMKIESNATPSEFIEVNLNTSNEGLNPSENWQTFTFNIADLANDGTLDVSGIDVIMIFPAWGTGENAVYRVADVKFHVPGFGGAPAEPLTTLIDAGTLNSDWALWDCCGGSTPTFVNDSDNGSVAEFAVQNGNSGTVLGVITRGSDGGNDMPIDASSLINSGVLRFDMKVITPPAAGNEGWLIKIESNATPSEFIEVNLNTSNEGVNPSENWQTFTFNVADLLNNGTLDVSGIDVIMIFPAWGTGENAVYRIDNMEFIDLAGGGTSTGGSSGGSTGADSGGNTDDGDGTDSTIAPNTAVMSGTFGGTSIDGNTFTFPATAENWAGFANENADLYPLNFPFGGRITFTAALPEGGSDTNVFFRLENAPFPDNETDFDTDQVTITGTTEQTYVIDFGAQDAEQEFNSLLMYIVETDSPVLIKDITVTANQSQFAMFSAFGNATKEGDVYTWPTGAEDWAGFANDNDSLYPMSFPYGGTITFTGSLNEGASDVNVRFRFERLPFPDVDPSFDTDSVTVTGTTEATYSITIPAQDATNTYSSFLMYLNERDAPVNIKDVEVTANPEFAVMSSFGNATVSDDVYTWPTGAEDWAGFANDNTGLYPLSFPMGGKVTFMAAVAEGGSDVNVRFRFERLPFPDVEPSFDTNSVTVTGSELSEYTIEFPMQDAQNTYQSFLMYLNDRDAPVTITNIKVEAYSNVAEMVPFGNATKEGNTFTFPTGAEDWAGFANDNSFVYPFSFPNGGTISFIASLPEGVADTNVRFRFERLPFPDVDPAFDVPATTISGTTDTEYTVTIPAQPSENNYSSFLLYINERDQAVMIKDIVVTAAQ